MKRVSVFGLILIAMTVWGSVMNCFAGDFAEVRFADGKFVYRDVAAKILLIITPSGGKIQVNADAVTEFTYDKNVSKLLIIKTKAFTYDLALDRVSLIATGKDWIEIDQ